MKDVVLNQLSAARIANEPVYRLRIVLVSAAVGRVLDWGGVNLAKWVNFTFKNCIAKNHLIRSK